MLFCCVMHIVYLSCAETDHQVSDEGVLSLAGAMAHHHTPTIRLSQLTTTDTE